MNNTILPDTSLCAIVRDEMINPAGGIVRFVESHMSFLESGVIVDTGSVDGTREALEELQKRFPNLAVYDRQFDDYTNSRNFSLTKIKTKRVLVLDVDELITQETFRCLSDDFKDASFCSYKGYNFWIREIYPIERPKKTSLTHNPRLFSLDSKFKYINSGHFKTTEFLVYREKFRADTDPRVIQLNRKSPVILHFVPDKEGIDKKNDEWYFRQTRWQAAPSQIDGFKEWKVYNLRRDDYQ